MLVVVIVVVLFLIVAIAIPFMGSVKRQKQHAVERAVDTIFSADEMDDRAVDWAKDAMADIIGNEKQQAKFEQQAVAEIKTMNGRSGAIAITVYLRGTKISDCDLEERYIKYAYEEDMISYHKDGYCFAVREDRLVCFVGKDCFVLDLD